MNQNSWAQSWACKDGRRTAISFMTNQHLRNCVAMIQRSKGRWRGEWLEPLCAELERRSGGQVHVERLAVGPGRWPKPITRLSDLLSDFPADFADPWGDS